MKAKDLTLMAMLCALLLVVQFALSFIVGIELVTLLVTVICAALQMRRSVLTITAFALLRNMMYAFRLDAFVLYITFFPLFAVVLCLLSRKGVRSALFYAYIGVASVLIFDAYSILLMHFITEAPIVGLSIGQILPTVLRVPTVFVSVLFLFQPLYHLLRRFTFGLKDSAPT